jgi:hypothetical protein
MSLDVTLLKIAHGAIESAGIHEACGRHQQAREDVELAIDRLRAALREDDYEQACRDGRVVVERSDARPVDEEERLP